MSRIKQLIVETPSTSNPDYFSEFIHNLDQMGFKKWGFQEVPKKEDTYYRLSFLNMGHLPADMIHLTN